jgi:hypothetical protein
MLYVAKTRTPRELAPTPRIGSDVRAESSSTAYVVTTSALITFGQRPSSTNPQFDIRRRYRLGMTDDASYLPELFDQDAYDASEGLSAEEQSGQPEYGRPNPLAAVGLAIVELNRSSQLLSQMVRHVEQSQP